MLFSCAGMRYTKRRTGMVKLVFCLRRRADLPVEEFHRYWRQEHGPLVARHAAALGIRRYVQLHTLDHPLNAALAASREVTGEPYDGLAELWWDSVDALAAGASTDVGRRAGLQLLEDERRFIDHSRSRIFIGEEQVIVPARSKEED